MERNLVLTDEMKNTIRELFHLAKEAESAWMDLLLEPSAVYLAKLVHYDLSKYKTLCANPDEYDENQE